MTVQTSTATVCVVTFAEDAQLVQRLETRMEDFSRKHGSRTIVLDGTVRADASAQGEMTRVGVQSMTPGELREAVHELLTIDVPCALFWVGNRIADPRFEALATLARNIVLDSSRVSGGTETITDLCALDPARHENLHDLAYLRLLPWQDMIAQFFDDADLAGDLPNIRAVEFITGSDAEAYYLSGWLGSRLNWQPCGRDEFCNEAGEPVKILQRREGQPRRVRSVVLRTAGSTYCAELDSENADLVCLTVSGKHARKERCAPLHDVDLVSLVEQALLAATNDPIFIESLQMVRALFAHAQ